MNPDACYCSDCGHRLAPGSRQGCCLNPDRATGELRRAGVIGALHWRELDGAERSLIVALLTRFEGQASEAELSRALGCPDRFLYEVAAPPGRYAAQISGCLYERDQITVTDQARDAYRAWTRHSGRRSEPALPVAA